MTEMTPAEVTAQAEPVANTMSGTYGGVTQSCTAPRSVLFLYDDPYKTPATAVLTRFLDKDVVLAETRSYHVQNYGAQCSTEDVPPVRSNLGVSEQPDLPRTPLDIDTGDEETLNALEQEAWELEKQIVADLRTFEVTMAGVFAPYVTEWNSDGWLGAGGDFITGVGSGMSSWWDGEKDFWGSVSGALKSSAAKVGNAVWDRVSNPIDTLQGIAQAHAKAITTGVDVVKALTEFMRGLLSGDVDKLFAALDPLAALKTAEGVIGEFGTLMSDLFAKGSEFLNGLLEVFRRTPVLGLIANSIMRVITLMTPNFWAEILGQGVGFILPEVLMWVISLIVSALIAATGVGAAGAVVIIAGKIASLASKLRKMISANSKIYAFVAFLRTTEPIIARVGPLGQKLRQSMYIRETKSLEPVKRVIIPTRHWIQKLDDLARQGHGPQRHEGAVTDKQLLDRVLHGLDPMTGSVVDHDKFFKKYGVHYDPIKHGTPPDFGGTMIHVPGKGDLPITMSKKIQHVSGAHATKFNTPEDYVKAYEWVIKDPRVKAFEGNSKPTLRIPDIKMSDIFGPDFEVRIKGYDAFGNRTVFGSDTNLIAIFEKDSNGILQLKTMYPDP
ncbi:hypothetical protein [Celeribacter naphthalenivorans]|uniref:hypothetical protein n=1 Tax=Celeribacter naphthalenivorans TaxID=1614694 RepID=UPI001CF9327C|nr:hypothetical protein [Celeribacter naphthalenivorans]